MNRDPPLAADDLDGEDYSASGCCCFRLFCFGSGRDTVEGRDLLRPGGGEQRESQRWLATKLREVKEASEMVAGPEWKNFIRRISKYFNKRRRNQFQYDPQGYALNFDDGVGEDDDGYMFGYSSRFSAPLSGEQRRAAGL